MQESSSAIDVIVAVKAAEVEILSLHPTAGATQTSDDRYLRASDKSIARTYHCSGATQD
jgi:hypothetical protein